MGVLHVTDHGPMQPFEVEPGKATRKGGVVAWQGAVAWLVSQVASWLAGHAGVEIDAAAQAALVAALTGLLHGLLLKVKARYEVRLFGVEVL